MEQNSNPPGDFDYNGHRSIIRNLISNPVVSFLVQQELEMPEETGIISRRGSKWRNVINNFRTQECLGRHKSKTIDTTVVIATFCNTIVEYLLRLKHGQDVI